MPSIGVAVSMCREAAFNAKAKQIEATVSEIETAKEIMHIGRQILGIRAFFSPMWKEFLKQKWQKMYDENPRAAQLVKAAYEGGRW